MFRLLTPGILVLALCGSSLGGLHFTGKFALTGADGAAFASETTTLTSGLFSVKATLTATGVGVTESVYGPANDIAGASSMGDTTNAFDNLEMVKYDLTFSDEILPVGEILVDGTFRALNVLNGTGTSESGTFDMNGNSYTWTDANNFSGNSTAMGGDFVAGSHFSDFGQPAFDLKLVDGGAAVVSFTKEHLAGEWSLNDMDIEVFSATAIPEPSGFAFLGVAFVAGLIGVKLRRWKK